mmetsp:Transcript_49076/g.147799  ORF Transcript_49076/g.147799 Transcript_49076/m.147799 type:complete len:322 (-) Transcript_49076:48-1013(-)
MTMNPTMRLSTDDSNPPACLARKDKMMDFFGLPSFAIAPYAFGFEEKPEAPASSSSSLESLKSSDACNNAPTSLLQLLQRPQSSSPTPELTISSQPQSPQSPQTSQAPTSSRPKSPPSSTRFKAAQETKWTQRIKDLAHFRSQHGHCSVPHMFPANPQLARWVKRQRRQYKLMLEGKVSALSSERVQQLEEMGFVWDSHDAAWTEKVEELRAYRAAYGDCCVPSTFKKNPQLAVWVKCQRRQYKLFWTGKKSSMTTERISELEKEGFCWEVRLAAAANKVLIGEIVPITNQAQTASPSANKRMEKFDSDEIQFLLDTISYL